MDKKAIREIARDIQSPVEKVRSQAVKKLDRLGRDAVPWLISVYLNDRYGGVRGMPYRIALPCYNLVNILLGLSMISVVFAPKKTHSILSWLGQWGDRATDIRLSMLPKSTSVDRGILLAALRFHDVAILEILGDALWCTTGTLHDECEQKVIELLPRTRIEEFKSLQVRDFYYTFLDYRYIDGNTELVVALVEFFARIKDEHADRFLRNLANDHIVFDGPMSAQSRERVVAAAKSAVARWDWPSLESPYPRAKPRPGGSSGK